MCPAIVQRYKYIHLLVVVRQYRGRRWEARWRAAVVAEGGGRERNDCGQGGVVDAKLERELRARRGGRRGRDEGGSLMRALTGGALEQ